MANWMQGLSDMLIGVSTGLRGDPGYLQRSKREKEETTLNNLYRAFLMKKMASDAATAQEERERLNRPISSLVSPEMRTPPPSLMPQEPPGMGRMMPAPDTLADIPYMEGGQARTARVPQMGRGMAERPPMNDLVGGMPMPTGKMVPALGLTLRDLPLAKQYLDMMKGTEPKILSGGPGTQFFEQGQGGFSKVGEVPPKPEEIKTPGTRTREKYDPNTRMKYKAVDEWVNGQWVPGGWQIVGEENAPQPPQPTAEIQEYHKWLEDPKNKGKTFTQFKEWQTGLSNKNTPEAIEKEIMDKYRDYNIARAKAPSDPIRLQMIAAMKQMGIDVPVSLPEMTYEQFKTFVTTGKMPQSVSEPAPEAPKKLNTLPAGSKKVGTYQGKTVYETPDGKRFVEE